MIPGFKASPLGHSESVFLLGIGPHSGRREFFFGRCCREPYGLSLTLCSGVPPKVLRAFKAFEYIPYTSLTSAARQKAERGEEDFTLNANGTMTAKKLDRRDERHISPIEWQASALLAVELARKHWPDGELRAKALAKHHEVVNDLADRHGWTVAVAYDIHQRELMHRSPQHDVSSLHDSALNLVTTQLLVTNMKTSQPLPPSPSPSPKRPAPFDAVTQPKKRTRVERGKCFRCGFPNHMLSKCRADRTVAGKTPVVTVANRRGGQALESTDGKIFCFAWTRSGACKWGDACIHVHRCSLCTEGNHGAGNCPSAA